MAILLMELSYIYLGLSLVRQGLEMAGSIFILVIAIYLEFEVINVIFGHSKVFHKIGKLLTRVLAAIISAGAIGLAVLQVLQSDLHAGLIPAVLGFCGLAWALGETLSRNSDPNYDQFVSRFQIGIFFVIIFSGAGQIIPMLVFALVGLFTLARMRWDKAAIGSRQVLQGFPSSRIIIGVGAVALTSFIVLILVSPDILRSIVAWFDSGYTGFINWFTNVMLADFWKKPLVDWQASCAVDGNQGEAAPSSPKPLEGGGMSPVVGQVLAFASFIVIIIVLFTGIKSLMRRRENKTAPKVAPVSQPAGFNVFVELWSIAGDILKGLKTLVIYLMGRIRAYYARRAANEALGSARAVYRELLRWMAKRAPRKPSQTAAEYLAVLTEVFPLQKNELTLITQTYLQARYSPHSLTTDQTDAVKGAWKKVKSAILSGK